MTDLITRARKEWCEIRPSPYSTSDTVIRVCPPEVVAALLDVIKAGSRETYCICCGVDQTIPHPHWSQCEVALAEAAITRALEGRP